MSILNLLKIAFSCIVFMIIFNSLSAQKRNGELEIKPYMRIDWYPEFTYRINTVNDNKVSIRGESYGISALYKYTFKNIHTSFGMGYYRNSFNNIDQKFSNSLFPNSNNRIINYVPPGPIAPLITYATDKYWYHSISVIIGAQKSFDLKRDWQFSARISLSNYFTFSQSYHVRDFKYKPHKVRYFGFSSSLELGFIKKMRNLSAGPVLILPVYDLWKQDNNFPKTESFSESNASSRDKWLSGIGLGMSFNFPLHKK